MNLELFYEIPFQDQRQYFEKTYFKVKLPEGDKFLWGYCSGFLDRNEAIFSFESRDRRGVSLRSSIPNFDFPESGLYNLRSSTILFQKIPKRQSKKGLCHENSSFTYFEDLFLSNRGNRQIQKEPSEIWCLRSIKEMFDDVKDFTLYDSMYYFKKRRPISFAINRNFGLSLGIKSKYLSLWYKQVLVGEVFSPKELLVYEDSLFKQEVVDNFSHENVKINEGKPQLS